MRQVNGSNGTSVQNILLFNAQIKHGRRFIGVSVLLSDLLLVYLIGLKFIATSEADRTHWIYDDYARTIEMVI